ncbi:unnamed protein product [Symbiodinium sp. CCMP2592]|nr:unnamed protein product [Symbiodinium sp. CCMP2592]
MKSNKQFQHKMLQKHIDVCEAANSLANNFCDLNNHAIDVCVSLLQDKNIVIPWSIQLQVTEKKLQFVFEELAKAPSTKLPDLTDRILESLCAWKHVSHPVQHEEDDDDETAKMKEESVTWSATRSSFNLLWMELEADIRDTSSEDTDEYAKLEAKAEELQSVTVSALACPGFFNLLESKNTAALLMLAEKYVGAYANDGVPELEDFHDSGKRACEVMKQALSSLVVLLVPTPGHLGTSPTDVTNVIAYEDANPKLPKTANQMDLLGTLQLFFQEDKFWQEAADEVLKLGTSTMKFGDELQDLIDDLSKEDASSDEVSEAFTRSVGRFDLLRKSLRKNATDKLEELIRARVERIIGRMCKTTEVSQEMSVHISLIMKALGFFPTAKGMMELRSKFVAWQNGMDKELSQQKLLTLADTLSREGPWPVNELKRTIDKACVGERGENLEPELVKKLDTVSWAMMERLATEASSDFEHMGFEVIPILSKAMSKCFQEDVAKALQQWIGLLPEALSCAKQLEKFRKLGQNTEVRLATDSKGNALTTLVKQYETFHTAHTQARKNIDAISDEDEQKIRFVALGIQDLPVFKIADDAIAALSAKADELKVQASDLTEKVSDMTHDKHLPDKSWKQTLSDTSTLSDVQTAASLHMDNDVSGLEKVLKQLIEVHNHIVAWHKRVKFMDADQANVPKLFASLASSTESTIRLGYVYKSEGLLACAIMEKDREAAIKLMRKELATLQGSQYAAIGVTENMVHPVLLAEAKNLKK